MKNKRLGHLGKGLSYTVSTAASVYLTNFFYTFSQRMGELKKDRIQDFNSIGASIGNLVEDGKHVTNDQLVSLVQNIDSLNEPRTDDLANELESNSNFFIEDNLQHQEHIKTVLVNTGDELAFIKGHSGTELEDIALSGSVYILAAMTIFLGCLAIKNFYRAIFKPK